MSLATKYRPTKLEDVVEQTITTEILKKQIESKSFKNAYLFAGASGCGKTTLARIFANLINQGLSDPIEIDAASNNSVESVREIVEQANQRSLVGEYKVIIIDECHALGNGSDSSSNKAWQAFLKGIEDCPKYTIYIFCSTAPEKLPTTIRNRLQRFNFTPISSTGIKNRLEYICQQEGFTNYTETCEFISKISNNSMRDAITNLEQVADLSTDLSLDTAKKVLGGVNYETMFKLTWAIKNKSETEIFELIDSIHNTGQDLKYFIDLYINFILDLAKFILFNNIEITNIPSYLATAENPVVQFTIAGENRAPVFMQFANKLLDIKNQIKYDLNYKNTILIMLINLVRADILG